MNNPIERCIATFLVQRDMPKDTSPLGGKKIDLSIEKRPTVNIKTKKDLDEYLKKYFSELDFNKTGICLSGGIDSALLASYLPKGTLAFTLKYPETEGVDEVNQARIYADKFGLRLIEVPVTFQDVLDYQDDLMLQKGEPLSPIEIGLHKMAVRALDFGLENLITGSGADLCFGGLFNLLSKKWTNEEFKERYTFVSPNKVMKVEAEPYDFYKDYNDEPYFKLDEFMLEIYGTATTKYFNNAMKLAGITLKAPYEYIYRDFELDYQRIKNGEEKYFLRELFKERIGDLFVPRKYPLPRPLKIWANYYGEIINKDIFYEDAYERCTRDEEKWLTYSADHYLYLLRNRCFNKYHRIYTTGVYDMFHIGHLNILKRASKMCDELIVGVTSDDLVSYKGKQSIIAFADRVRLVRALPFVTKAVVQENMNKVAACKHYEIDAIVVGDDWKNTEKWNDYEKQLKDIGVDVVYLPYTKRVSSTKLVEEIKHK